MFVLSNKPLKILLITNAAILISGAWLGPIYALFVKKIGGDLLDASFTYGIYALAAGITTYISGKYADKLKENELIVVFGYIIIGVSFISFIFVKTILSLFIIQVIMGFGEAIYSPAFDALYSKHLDGHASGREWGAWETMNYLTISVGAITGGILVTLFGFNIVFVFMGIVCLCSAFYILHLPRKVL